MSKSHDEDPGHEESLEDFRSKNSSMSEEERREKIRLLTRNLVVGGIFYTVYVKEGGELKVREFEREGAEAYEFFRCEIVRIAKKMNKRITRDELMLADQQQFWEVNADNRVDVNVLYAD